MWNPENYLASCRLQQVFAILQAVRGEGLIEGSDLETLDFCWMSFIFVAYNKIKGLLYGLSIVNDNHFLLLLLIVRKV